jgi:hypothetical protein
MFSLIETEKGKFTYHCHGCGWEIELTTTNQIAAADEASTSKRVHHCAPEMGPSSDTKGTLGELSRGPGIDLDLSRSFPTSANDGSAY